MTEEINYLPIQQFIDLGYLQEVNRLVLHPAGLALEINPIDAEIKAIIKIWDYRQDAEGMLFGEGEISQRKIENVSKARMEKYEFRTALGLINNIQDADTKLNLSLFDNKE